MPLGCDQFLLTFTWLFQFFQKVFIKLFCQTIVSWRFFITKTFHRKNHFLFTNFFVKNFFSSWLKVDNKMPLRNSLYACFVFLSFLFNKFPKNLSDSLLIPTKLSISLLYFFNFLTVSRVAVVFSRFKKKLVDFSPSSYH